MYVCIAVCLATNPMHIQYYTETIPPPVHNRRTAYKPIARPIIREVSSRISTLLKSNYVSCCLYCPLQNPLALRIISHISFLKYPPVVRITLSILSTLIGRASCNHRHRPVHCHLHILNTLRQTTAYAVTLTAAENVTF